MEFINGKKYLITHTRKGTFSLQVTSQSDTWLTGTVLEGTAA